MSHWTCLRQGVATCLFPYEITNATGNWHTFLCPALSRLPGSTVTVKKWWRDTGRCFGCAIGIWLVIWDHPASSQWWQNDFFEVWSLPEKSCAEPWTSTPYKGGKEEFGENLNVDATWLKHILNLDFFPYKRHAFLWPWASPLRVL